MVGQREWRRRVERVTDKGDRVKGKYRVGCR